MTPIVTTTPSGPPSSAVVLEDPLVGVELLARLEGDRVHPALGVGELHLVAGLQGAAAAVGAER